VFDSKKIVIVDEDLVGFDVFVNLQTDLDDLVDNVYGNDFTFIIITFKGKKEKVIYILAKIIKKIMVIHVSNGNNIFKSYLF
jgi:hypothetical protein